MGKELVVGDVVRIRGADIVEALKKEYNLEHYYEVDDLLKYISKHLYTIEKEIEARHPEENIL